MRSVMAALGSWSIIVIVIAWCLAILSQTHTHCAQPLHRSTATYADPYLRPFSLPALSSYRMVLASGQYCVHSLQLVAAQISTLMSATRYMQVSSSSVQWDAAWAAAKSSTLFASALSSTPQPCDSA